VELTAHFRWEVWPLIRRNLILVAIAAGTLQGCGADAYAPAPLSGQLSYASRASGSHDIYLINVDGTGLRNLTNHQAWDGDHAWSPDGSKIAFSSSREWGLLLMNADGSGLRNVTGDTIWAAGAKWSPDGSQLVFKYEWYIYRVNLDGSGLVQLTDEPGWYSELSWSPGPHILFKFEPLTERGGRGGTYDLYTIDPRTGSQVNLTSDPEAWEDSPRWSPDGLQVLFAASDGLYLVRPDGSGRTRITPDMCCIQCCIHDPRWSPDGSTIAFEYRDDIFTIPAAGGTLRNLTPDHAINFKPAWSPDGRLLAYQSDRTGYVELWVAWVAAPWYPAPVTSDRTYLGGRGFEFGGPPALEAHWRPGQ
jgi:Tol biopolymer transport system component